MLLAMFMLSTSNSPEVGMISCSVGIYALIHSSLNQAARAHPAEKQDVYRVKCIYNTS